MITQQEIFNKVGAILTELNQQHQFLVKNSGQLEELEIELFLANADFLADHVRIIQKLNVTKQPSHDDNPKISNEDNVFDHSESLSPESDNTEEIEAIEEIVAAEQEEERVDIKPQEEVREEELVHHEIAEEKTNQFFTPDFEERSFEFELEKVAEARGDVEEHTIAADNDVEDELEDPIETPTQFNDANSSEDEIGPEPFLIHEEEHEQIEEDVEEDIIEEVIEPTHKYVAPTTAERQERNGIDLQSGSSSLSSAGDIPSFSPEVVRTEPLPSNFEVKESSTLNDRLANRSQKPETSAKAPISDLKQAINLNEKMLFIRDLFSGYNMAYSEAIELVNKMTTFENADRFLRNNYGAKNNWASKQDTLDQFYELLHRRFDR